MKRYEQIVIETRTYEVLYTVEAETKEEAEEMFETGETIDEKEIKCLDVTGRHPWDTMKLVKH